MGNIEHNKPAIIKFEVLKLWLRLAALGFASLILGVNIYAIKAGEHSAIAIIFGILFLFTALYENSWQFDLEKKIAMHKYGIIFLYKKRLINFSEIFNITVDTFKQPARFGTFTRIYMKLVDGEVISIDGDKTRNLQKEIEEIEEVRLMIKKNNDKKVQDFSEAVGADIL